MGLVIGVGPVVVLHLPCRTLLGIMAKRKIFHTLRRSTFMGNTWYSEVTPSVFGFHQ